MYLDDDFSLLIDMRNKFFFFKNLFIYFYILMTK